MNHYTSFFHNILNSFMKKNIEVIKGKKIVICWSGGKDSTVLLSLMATWSKKAGVPLTVLMVPYPNSIINNDGRTETLDYWERKNINISVLQHDNCDPDNVPMHLACNKCKEIRRSVLINQYFQQHELANIILVTGHNAWDLAAYALELITKKFNSDKNIYYERKLEVMNKFLPIYHHKNGPTFIRPLLSLSDKHFEKIIKQENIPFPFSYIPHKCPWLRQRKRLLQKYFTHLNIEFSYDKLFKYTERIIEFPSIDEYAMLPFETYIL